MGKPVVFLAAALGLLRVLFPVGAQTNQNPTSSENPSLNALKADTVAAANRIAGFSAWDDDFLYLAIQVNKPTLNGKNTAPYSNPLEDDAILISLQADNDHTTTKRTDQTFVIAISGMGGAQLYSGAEATPLFASFEAIGEQLEAIAKNEPDLDKQAKLRGALLGRLLKFQVNPKGSLRATGNALPGYTVELAIPWVNLGGKPNPNTKMGFHIAAQSITPDSPALQSLLPKVKSVEDLNNPSLWGEIVLGSVPVASKENVLTAPRVLGAKPNVDGDVIDNEWPALSAFEFGERAATTRVGVTTTLAARVRPEFTPQPSRPVVPVETKSEPLAMPARIPQKAVPLTLARYFMDYQADTRQSIPTVGVWKENGATALSNRPLDGAGPWMSTTRADWHRRQLVDLRRSGVDVILPVYRPTPNTRRASDRGLLALASALNLLLLSGQDYPQVALHLDTTALEDSYGKKPDLKETGTQAALYAAIRDFFLRIPAPFRLTIPLSAQNEGRRANVVLLSSASAFSALDSAFVSYVRGRFAQDFDNADLVLIGGSDFKGKSTLDGYFTDTKEKGFQFEAEGWIKIASVGAGYDATLTGSTNAPRRSRRNGETYRADWTAALDKRPDWVLLDGWNDFTHGAAITPTLEAGYGPSDMTRVYTRLFAGQAKRGVKFLWHDSPSALLSNREYAIHVRAQNTGIEGWDTNGAPGLLPVGIAYRWLKDGQTVATGTAPDFASSVLAGQNVTATLAVKTQGLANGDYLLEIGAAQVDRKGSVSSWVSSAAEGSMLQIPVRVSDKATRSLPEWAATLVSTELPLTPETGSVYEIRAQLRNDGATTWRKADGARVTARLFQMQGERQKAKGESESLLPTPYSLLPVVSADATALLDSDVAPGQVATVKLKLPLLDPTGKPLPASDLEGNGSYSLRWEVTATGEGRSALSGGVQVAGLNPTPDTQHPTPAGISIAPQTINVTDFDFGIRFLSDGTPAILPGQRRLPVRVSLQNVGPQTWKKDSVRVGYHWYYLDGTEFLWEDETTPLTEDVPSGGKVNDMLAWVTAPPYDGTYYLVWDVKVGETWSSTTDSARAFDTILREVKVTGGKLVFADLTKFYNVDGVSDEDNPKDGDFDGTGRTFPASLLPPFADTSFTPVTFGQAAARTGPDSPRRISFRLGTKEAKANNFVSCKGQRIDLGKSAAQCRVLHILAASSGEDIVSNLKLIFQEPTSESADLLAFSVGKWSGAPAKPEQTGFTLQRVNTPNGSQSGVFGLHHYVITVREPRKLIALQLPNAPEIKIAALTLEK